MTRPSIDPVTQVAFSVSENPGVFAILAGSGLSRSAQIPTGWEITLDLVRRVALAQGIAEQPDWAAWYRDTTGHEPNYSTLLEEIANSPDERRAILHRYIEPSEQDREEGRKIPTPAHHAIAQLVRAGYIRVIVTTNFDRLMENALREQGVEPTVVASVDSLAGAEPLTHSRCYVVKLHGDYKDARILNTDEELSAYPEPYNRLLDRIFDEHGMIICGWSGDWDHALRAAFLRAPNRRYPVYWAARGALGSGAKELAAHRAAKVVAITGADAFFTSLQQRVEILEQSQKQNPLSIELLVSSAKRFVAKPEHRIQLDDLLANETRRLLDALEAGPFSMHETVEEGIFRKRVSLYESLTEPLGRISGVVGRWGGDGDLHVVLDVLRSLYHHARTGGGGFVVWVNLKAYPAVLVFTAYGIALAKAGRWSTLLQLFSAPIASEHGEQQRVVSTLFLNAWEGGKKETWNQLERLKTHKTPLSDHLLEVMTLWKTSFAGVEADFELLFERFELLAALAVFHENDEASLETSRLEAERNNRPLAWMPVGRVGWKSSEVKARLKEFEDEVHLTKLLDAGFAKGSRRLLQLFVENFQWFARRMSW